MISILYLYTYFYHFKIYFLHTLLMASAKNPHERLVARLAAEDRRHARAMKKIQKDSLT